MVSLHALQALLLLVLLIKWSCGSEVLGSRRPCHGSEDKIRPLLAMDEACGVYTIPCALGLRCVPPRGVPGPLQALLQGRGVCKHTKSLVTEPPTLSFTEPSAAESTEQQEELGPCRKLLHTVLHSVHMKLYHSLHHIYIPNCDKRGSFRKRQCHSSHGSQRGRCWCVDENGARVSSRKRVDGGVSCD